MKYGAFVVVLVWGTAFSLAQESAPSASEPGAIHNWNERILDTGRTLTATSANALQDYQIGAEDLVEIAVFEVLELSRSVRVSASGEICLPLLGAVKVAGLSPMQLEQALTDRLRVSYLRNPQVSVFLREYKSDPVSVMSAVKMPGLHHIQTRKSLIEVLTMAQGFSEGPLRQPGRIIIISRNPETRWVVQSNGPAEENHSVGATPTADGAGTMETEGIAIPEEASQKFDYIVLDSPPVLHVTNARILAAQLEAVILVTHGAVTPREAVKHAKQHLQRVNGNLIGVVLNNVDFSAVGYDYYYRYYRGYGYKYGYGYGRDEGASANPQS